MESVVVTGGTGSYSRVQEYNETGSVARLPDLTAGRWEHSCGHYIHNGDIVSVDTLIMIIHLNVR